MKVTHLHREKVIQGDSMYTRPDPKHAENIFRILGIDKQPPTKEVATPGVKRTESEEVLCEKLPQEQTHKYRSAVWSMIY